MPLLPLAKAFTAPAIGVYFNNYVQTTGEAPYLGGGFFPKVKTSVMDLKWFKGSKGLPISLTPSHLDALATVRDRIGFKMIEEDMPFFRESYLVKEKDAQEYENFMNAADPAIAKQILNNIMLSASDLIMGASVVPERMIWQLLAPIDGSPKISIVANGVNVDYNYDKDGSYVANNFMELTTATDKWTDLASSDPYKDIRTAQKAMQKKRGIKPSVAVMNDNTFQLIVENAKIHNYLLAQNATANVMVDDDLVKSFFTKKLGLTIIIYDKMYRNEAGTETNFMPDNMVTLLPGMTALGETRYGKTPEERTGAQTPGTVSIVDTGVSVYRYATPHPINEVCIVSEIVLPTYERMDDTYVIKVA